MNLVRHRLSFNIIDAMDTEKFQKSHQETAVVTNSAANSESEPILKQVLLKIERHSEISTSRNKLNRIDRLVEFPI